MQWLYPANLWSELLLPLLVTLGCLGEHLRYRRLYSFGDPLVLGVRAGSARRLGMLSLIVLGIGLIAAIPAVPLRRETTVPSVAFLLDTGPWEGSGWQGEESSRNLSDCLQVMMRQIPAAHFAVLNPGNETKSIVPPTSDSMGLLMAAGGWRPPVKGISTEGLATAIGLLTEKQKKGEVPYTQFVVVTARPAAGADQLISALAPLSANILFASLRTVDSPMRFGTRDGDLWRWTADIRRPPRARDDSIHPVWPWNTGLSAIQMFALLGFLVLWLESLWSLSDEWVRSGY